MRAWGHGMTWWARTTQKSGSRLLLEAAVPVWLWSACKAQAMASDKFWRFGAPWAYFPPSRDAEEEAVEAAFGDIGSRGFDFPPEYAKADVGWAGEEEADEDVAEA